MVAPPTAADVARRAGTSTAVVSYVVNDGPRPVAAATRKRVLDAIDELGYRPNRAARTLRTRRSGTVGIIVPTIANPFFSAIAQTAQDVAARRDLLTLVAAGGFDERGIDEAAEIVARSSVDGLIVVGGTRIDFGVPTVHVHDGPECSRLVAADNEASGALAVQHLVDRGYETVDLLTSEVARGAVAARARGWRAALETYRCDGRRHVSTYDRLDAAAAIEPIIARADSLGLVCATDEQAFGALTAAQRLGVDVPSRIGIVAIDGTVETMSTWPPLTAVVLPIGAMIEAAIEALLTDTEIVADRHAPHLVERRSTGATD